MEWKNGMKLSISRALSLSLSLFLVRLSASSLSGEIAHRRGNFGTPKLDRWDRVSNIHLAVELVHFFGVAIHSLTSWAASGRSDAASCRWGWTILRRYQGRCCDLAVVLIMCSTGDGIRCAPRFGSMMISTPTPECMRVEGRIPCPRPWEMVVCFPSTLRYQSWVSWILMAHSDMLQIDSSQCMTYGPR